ncbi:hypothetical protein INE74_02169 [Bacteroides ovatus CL03T12C18]|nr:hypothetical protein HMPREF1070_02119 [Bacteroides ovatus CL03T12C18]MBT0713225.1 hypothetical protein [Bacteroides ovatus CL03T12C18]
MIKRVVIQLCWYGLGLSSLAVHALCCYMLLGLTGTLVIAGVQLLIAAGVIYMRIRAPD